MVVEVLAVVMRLEDGQAQTATADWTLHLRGNRAKRLLSKHNTPLPADLHPARSKSAFDWDLKSPALKRGPSGLRYRLEFDGRFRSSPEDVCIELNTAKVFPRPVPKPRHAHAPHGWLYLSRASREEYRPSKPRAYMSRSKTRLAIRSLKLCGLRRQSRGVLLGRW
jgi:hypothetical protein